MIPLVPMRLREVEKLDLELFVNRRLEVRFLSPAPQLPLTFQLWVFSRTTFLPAQFNPCIRKGIRLRFGIGPMPHLMAAEILRRTGGMLETLSKRCCVGMCTSLP